LNYTRQIPWRWTHFSPEGRNNIHPLGGLSQRPILRQATSWKSAPFRVRAIVSSPIPAITARHSLSPRSFTHSRMSLSCERPRPQVHLRKRWHQDARMGLPRSVTVAGFRKTPPFRRWFCVSVPLPSRGTTNHIPFG